MFEEDFGLYNENSLDLLLRFNLSEEEENFCHSAGSFSNPSKDFFQT